MVESKADMKKRGMRSPDLADAFLRTFACGDLRKRKRRAALNLKNRWNKSGMISTRRNLAIAPLLVTPVNARSVVATAQTRCVLARSCLGGKRLPDLVGRQRASRRG